MDPKADFFAPAFGLIVENGAGIVRMTASRVFCAPITLGRLQ
jgi:hypothetical protein